MMYSGLDDITKRRIMQARALSMEAKGVGLNLGKKICVPKNIMMEELNLPSNRGSRMFQERQKRAERFTLENAVNGIHNTSSVLAEILPPPQNFQPVQRGKENQDLIIPGKHNMVKGLQKSVAMKGRPDVLTPGYSGPLKEAPCEKFNATVVPKAYCSPWTVALGGSEEFQNVLNAQLLQNQPPPASYRCFNRSAVPFRGATTSQRAIPVMSFEAVESQQLPAIAPERMCRRPNFNRAPRGWGVNYQPESNEL